MPLTFPLALDSFFAGLKITSCSFAPDESYEISRNGAGEILTADRGSRLMVGDVTLAPAYNRDAAAIGARLSLLRQAGRPLFVHPHPIWTPAYDPTGAILGAAVPTIHTLNSNNREMRVQGLPVGYQLTEGDYLSFPYRTNPARYAIHQIAQTVVVPAGGVSPLFEVGTFIRPGAAVGTAVTLVRPFFKAILVPGSTNTGTSDPAFTTGIRFSIMQTLG